MLNWKLPILTGTLTTRIPTTALGKKTISTKKTHKKSDERTGSSDSSFLYISQVVDLLFCLGLSGLEVGQILHQEVLDVGSLSADILLSHTYINIGRLLEELRTLGGIADDEQ